MISLSRYNRSLILGTALVAALSTTAGLKLIQPASAEIAVKSSERTVSVAATGSVSAIPDRAAITSGVTTDAATARDAMSANATIMQRLIDGLKTQNIDASDIRTTSVQVTPRYAQSRGGDRPPGIIGYSANNQIRIVVRDIKKLGEILDQAITLGANQMGGIAFEVSDAEAKKDAARKLAISNARRRAELYASAAGVAVGPVLTISETVLGDQPRHLAGNFRMAKGEPVPIEAGNLDLSVEIQVTWQLQ
jgi:uncharacterized protein